MVHGPRNKTLDFGDNPDHVTLELGLCLGGAEIDSTTYSALMGECVLAGVCSIVTITLRHQRPWLYYNRTT